MKKTSIIDIISPVMIGPSSSHTAGAVRLGLLARNIYSAEPNKVVFKLYNSYAQTGIGHGTEKGLLAGVLGLSVDDRRIKNIFSEDIPFEYKFEYYENFKKHPNAVDFEFYGGRNMFIKGESVGAGEVVVRNINEFYVKLTGKLNTLMVVYEDVPGIISKVTDVIQKHNINIASLHCDRYEKGKDASMCICVDSEMPEAVIEQVRNIDEISFLTYIKKLEG